MQSYSGDLIPLKVYEVLRSDTAAVLVDVRTSAEWHYVGVPDLASLGRSPVNIEFRQLPEMNKNSKFLEMLNSKVQDKLIKVYFLCRTGGRSQEAAIMAYQDGYKFAFNITDGFEGELDGSGHRGKINGWKASRLPWRQD